MKHWFKSFHHIGCRQAKNQLEDEIKRVLDFSLFMLKSFEFESFKLFLSTRPKEYVGEIEVWNKAEGALKDVLEASGLPWEIQEGDGAFYGPKIDINITDSIGRLWQLSTVQVDFNLPERFDISYVGEDGQEHRPIMLHRALLGSIERFFGVLIEHFKGAFPMWLAPVQVAVLPVSEKHAETADKFVQKLVANGIRVKLDDRNEKVGYKIREWSVQKVPYIVVIGDNEADLKAITVRKRGGEQETFATEDFLAKLNSENYNGVYY